MKRSIQMLAAGIVLLLGVGHVPAAVAQDQTDDDRIVVEIDDQGRVIVNGETVADGEGDVVVRVAPGANVDIDGPGERVRMRRGPGDRPVDRFVYRSDDGSPTSWHMPNPDQIRRFMSDFQMPDFEMPHVDMPHIDMHAIGPMMDEFRFELRENLGDRMEEHREVAELERRSRDLAREARNADDAERDALEEELGDVLGQIFDKKMEIRQERIEDLQEHLQEERENYQERAGERGPMIERRMEELLGTGDSLEW